jgi:hypothetical protein
VGPPPPPAPRLETPSGVLVEYRGEQPVLIRGLGSGRTYAFSPGLRSRSVPAGDAAQLLESPLFSLSPVDEERRSHGTPQESDGRRAGGASA